MPNNLKTKTAILVIIGILLTFCAPESATQESGVTPESPVTEARVRQEPVVTGEPVVTEPPTEPPLEPALICLTLLAPINGADLSPVGKVTFSWMPMAEAGNYVLMFILPSGGTVSFETDQPFRDRYMEAFEAGGEYQWQVTAQGEDGSELCVSALFTFDKPAFEIAPTGEPD